MMSLDYIPFCSAHSMVTLDFKYVKFIIEKPACFVRTMCTLFCTATDDHKRYIKLNVFLYLKLIICAETMRISASWTCSQRKGECKKINLYFLLSLQYHCSLCHFIHIEFHFGCLHYTTDDAISHQTAACSMEGSMPMKSKGTKFTQ